VGDVERQPCGGRLDAVDGLDPLLLRGREAGVHGHVPVGVELLAGLAEIVEVDRSPALARRWWAAVGVALHRPGHRHLGADAGQRLEHLGLGVVEAGGECRDDDHEADPEGQGDGGEERAAFAAPQLGAEIAEVEQGFLSIGLPANRTSAR
jgi:hypothetical protein